MKISVAVAFLLFAAVALAGEPLKVGAYTFVAPNGWKSVAPSSPMRKAQLQITKGADKAEVTFFEFDAGQGGSVTDNVDRWFNQFPGSEGKRKTETVQAGSVKITFATTEGTFDSGMPGGHGIAKSSYALHGAILEGTNGNVFVKLTGPEAIVKPSGEAFKKMITEAAKASGPRA
jgi:hypothetical protein